MTRTSTFLISTGVLAVVALAAATYVRTRAASSKAPHRDATATERMAQSDTVEFAVEGMSCVSCVASIKSAVAALDGVRGVEVSLEARKALVEYDPAKTSATEIAAAITKAGYTVARQGEAQPAPSADENSSIETVTIPIEGMTCASCTASVKRAVIALEGVRSAEVDLAARSARVEYDRNAVTPEQLAAAIRTLGFKPGTPVVGGDK